MFTYEPTTEELEDFFKYSDPFKCQEMWEKIVFRLQKQNILITSFTLLGQGSMGEAYQINDKYVLKITKDDSEPHSSYIVKKHPSVCFVKIKDVFCIQFGLNKPLYIILQEKLQKSKQNWRMFIQEVKCSIVDPRAIADRKSVFCGNRTLTELQEHQFKWLEHIGRYFEKHNIKYSDLHTGNVMRKGRKHKVIDLGYTKCPPQKLDVLSVQTL